MTHGALIRTQVEFKLSTLAFHPPLRFSKAIVWTHFDIKKRDTSLSRQKSIVGIRQHDMDSKRGKGQTRQSHRLCLVCPFFLVTIIVILRPSHVFVAGVDESPFICLKLFLPFLRLNCTHKNFNK
ncbi:MAG: hypothetical protein EA390_06610 [Balneolaceae bacterium]|nr:MAG: hypothetical protein EA390_06610 [Balneolaceae bacterium]